MNYLLEAKCKVWKQNAESSNYSKVAANTETRQNCLITSGCRNFYFYRTSLLHQQLKDHRAHSFQQINETLLFLHYYPHSI